MYKSVDSVVIFGVRSRDPETAVFRRRRRYTPVESKPSSELSDQKSGKASDANFDEDSDGLEAVVGKNNPGRIPPVKRTLSAEDSNKRCITVARDDSLIGLPSELVYTQDCYYSELSWEKMPVALLLWTTQSAPDHDRVFCEYSSRSGPAGKRIHPCCQCQRLRTHAGRRTGETRSVIADGVFVHGRQGHPRRTLEASL